MNIAIVGATGNVGRKMLEVLEQKKFPINQLYLVASSRSAGKKINFNGKEHEIYNLETYDFSKAEITFFVAGGKIVRILEGDQGFSLRFMNLSDEAINSIEDYLDKN